MSDNIIRMSLCTSIVQHCPNVIVYIHCTTFYKCHCVHPLYNIVQMALCTSIVQHCLNVIVYIHCTTLSKCHCIHPLYNIVQMSLCTCIVLFVQVLEAQQRQARERYCILPKGQPYTYDKVGVQCTLMACTLM